MQRADQTGVALALVAMAIVGSSVAVSGTLTRYPLYLGQAGRYAAATLLLGLLLRRQHTAAPRLRPAELTRLLALALTGLVGFNACLIEGAKHADPSTLGVVVGATPLVLAVLAPVLDGRRPSPRVVGAAGIVVLGVVLVEGLGATTPLGTLYAVGALAGEVLFSLLAASLLPRLGPLRLSTWVCAAAVPLLLVIGVGRGERVQTPSGSELAALAWMALMVTVVAFLTWYSALGRLGVERAAVFPGLIPVSALASAVVIGTGRFTVVGAIGAALVTVGVVVGVRSGSVTVSG